MKKIKILKLTKPKKGDDTKYTNILLEEFKEQFKIFGEGLEFVQERVTKLELLSEEIIERIGKLEAHIILIEHDISDIKAEIKLIKELLDKKVDSEKFNGLEQRVIKLEKELALLRRN